MFKLIKLQFTGKNNQCKKEPVQQNQQIFRPLWPERTNFDNELSSQTRPWNYRFTYQSPQNRPYVPNHNRNLKNLLMPMHIPKNRPNLHYQRALLPDTLRVCLNNCSPNVYHWVSDSPVKIQTLDLSILTQNNIAWTQNHNHDSNDSLHNSSSNHWRLIVTEHVYNKGTKRKTNRSCQNVTQSLLNGKSLSCLIDSVS